MNAPVKTRYKYLQHREMKFLHFAFAGAWFGRSHHRESLFTLQKTSLSERVNCNAGGHKFPLCEDDIRKFPSFALKQSVDTTNKRNEHNIERSGHLFKFIYAFLANGHVPRDPDGKITLDSSTIEDLKVEAAFYGLPELVNELMTSRKRTEEPNVADYFLLRNYFHNVTCDAQDIECSSNLVSALKHIARPFCISGTNKYELEHDFLIGNSTVHNLNITELIAAADSNGTVDQLEYCIGLDSDSDSEVEPYATNFVPDGIPYEELAPQRELHVSSKGKLVIHQKGFAQDVTPVLTDSHNTNTIGKLMLILNFTYTGGELEVTHGGRTEVVTGPYSWVAMYGDCLHKINPVTSGTRVSLIYDINAYWDKDRLWGYIELDEWLEPVPTSHKKLFDVTDQAKDRLHECLLSEFENWDTILICLENLYTRYPTQPVSLKSADKILFNILSSSDKYEVSIVAVNVCHSKDKSEEDGEGEGHAGWALFSPDFVHNNTLRNAQNLGRAKLVVPAPFTKAGLLEYREHMEYVQDESTKYVQSALQVRRIRNK